MDEWDDRDEGRLKRAVGQALSEELEGRRRATRSGAEHFLWIASALLLGTNLLLILAAFANLVGGLGPVTPSRILWTALGLDLLGASLLAWIVWNAAGRVEGRPRLIRKAAALSLIAWVGLTATWRFALPAAIGTNLEDLFTSFLTGPVTSPTDVRRDLSAMYDLFGLWIAAATVFVTAQGLLVIARRTAEPDDWVRGLPAYAWLLAAVISLLATVFIVLSFLSVVAGQSLADNFNAWLIAKVIVAPNVFISGYASSLDLGRRIRASRTKRP
jgi:hypothetical protein